MIRILIVAMLVAAATPAPAALLLTEHFNYPAGALLNGQTNPSSGNNWQRPGAPAGNSSTAVVTAGNLNYPGVGAPPSTNSFGLPRNTQSNISKITVPGGPYNHSTASTSVFFSMVIQLTSWSPITDTVAASQTHREGDFIAGYTAAAGANAMSAANVYAGQLRIRRQLDANSMQNMRYELGINKNNSGGAGNWAPSWDTTQSFAVGDKVFVVAEYQFGTNATTDDTVRLWINPTSGQPAGLADVTSSFGNDVYVGTAPNHTQGSVNSFWLRDGNTFLPGPMLVDSIRIGATYADVTGFIPEPSGAGLVVALFGLMAPRLRRRHI
jgi:hypothetical protein